MLSLRLFTCIDQSASWLNQPVRGSRCANPPCVAGGIIIAFRGTEATNLLNWRTNITINMTRHKTLGGIHDGNPPSPRSFLHTLLRS